MGEERAGKGTSQWVMQLHRVDNDRLLNVPKERGLWYEGRGL